jgi:hypothetical protein
LADAGEHGLGERFDRESEGEHRGAGAAVGRFSSGEEALDADLGVAADHARAVAGELPERRVEPIGVRRRNHDPRVAHAERFGERVDDERLADAHESRL